MNNRWDRRVEKEGLKKAAKKLLGKCSASGFSEGFFLSVAFRTKDGLMDGLKTQNWKD